MCGIAGYLGTRHHGLLTAMQALIAHRGPDGQGLHEAEVSAKSVIGLAHTRLAIIDVDPRSDQPMHRRHCHIVFNGEIYNYRELRTELEGQGERFCTSSDTEVLLAAYERWGARCVDKLEGMYAFAIWDDKSKSLFLARDPFGVKPLYWTKTQTVFAFASELKALLPIADLDRSLDHQAVLEYLTFLWTPAERTMFRSVHKLLPGSTMLVTPDGLVVSESVSHNAWGFGEHRAGAAPAELVADTRRLLRAAVDRQLVADVPVGTFLSGGVDSTAITAYARELGVNDAFTIATTGSSATAQGFTDDLPYARLAAKALGVTLHEVADVSEDLGQDLRDAVWHLDEPQADPAVLSARRISGAARDLGVKVLLSGAGGDDLFAGYRRHLAIRGERYWQWAPSTVRIMVAQTAARTPPAHPLLRRARKLLMNAGASDRRRLTGYFAWSTGAELQSLLSADVRSHLASLDAQSALDPTLDELPGSASPLDRALSLEMRHFLAAHNLNYTDKLTMAEGIEVRVPFLDGELARFAAAIPDQWRCHRRSAKWVLKEAVRPDVPQEVIDRPKSGFSGTLRDRSGVGLTDIAADTLLHGEPATGSMFDARALQRLIAGVSSGGIGDAYYRLLAVLSIELWVQQFAQSTLHRVAAVR